MKPRRAMLQLGWVAALCAALLACESSNERTRCARCGMYTDLSPGFAARAGERAYDTPKCLWSDLVAGKADREQAEVTEYYTQRRLAVDRAAYVVGSDILGPMGPDLIPVAPHAAARFAEEHGGRVVMPAQIDRAILDGL